MLDGDYCLKLDKEILTNTNVIHFNKNKKPSLKNGKGKLNLIQHNFQEIILNQRTK